MNYLKKLKEKELDPKRDVAEQVKELVSQIDYLEQLEDLATAVRKVEEIVKKINGKKQAIRCVSVSVPLTTIVSPALRTETESEIVCYSGIPSDQAFVLSEIAETEFDEETSYYYCSINGVEVNQWGEPKND